MFRNERRSAVSLLVCLSFSLAVGWLVSFWRTKSKDVYYYSLAYDS